MEPAQDEIIRIAGQILVYEKDSATGRPCPRCGRTISYWMCLESDCFFWIFWKKKELVILQKRY